MNDKFKGGNVLVVFLSMLLVAMCLVIFSQAPKLYRKLFVNSAVEKVVVGDYAKDNFMESELNFFETQDRFRLFRFFKGPPFPVREGDRIKTNDNQRIRINFWDSSIVLGPDTEIEIGAMPGRFFAGSNKKITIVHIDGTITIHSKNTSDAIGLDNEFFSAGPVGTIYSSIKNLNGFDIITLKGSVLVQSKNTDWAKSVTPGFRAEIRPPEKPELKLSLDTQRAELIEELIDVELAEKISDDRMSNRLFMNVQESVLHAEMRKMEYAQEEYRLNDNSYASEIGMLSNYPKADGVEIKILEADRSSFVVDFKMYDYRYGYLLYSSGIRKRYER